MTASESSPDAPWKLAMVVLQLVLGPARQRETIVKWLRDR